MSYDLNVEILRIWLYTKQQYYAWYKSTSVLNCRNERVASSTLRALNETNHFQLNIVGHNLNKKTKYNVSEW